MSEKFGADFNRDRETDRQAASLADAFLLFLFFVFLAVIQYVSSMRRQRLKKVDFGDDAFIQQFSNFNVQISRAHYQQ